MGSCASVEAPLARYYSMGKVIGKGAHCEVRAGKSKSLALLNGTPNVIAIKVFFKEGQDFSKKEQKRERRLSQLEAAVSQIESADEHRLARQSLIRLQHRRDSTPIKGPIEQILHEVKVLKLLEHPCVVHLYDTIETDQRVYAIMEMCSGGNMEDFLMHHNSFPESDTSRWIYECLQALDHLHYYNVVHREINPSNILLTSSDIRSARAKLCDFGRSVQLECGDSTLSEPCPKSLYNAPEVVAGLYTL
eukprot:GHVR01052952.1.p1 GENE.GHVR01052952.1~~GHVR01052952.1.p1  ORF type:complete len:248 (-),score=44.65 GHVR01052952.1:675-1418(-)